MRRRAFRFVSVFSLTLCLATIALWVRSYTFTDVVEWGPTPSGNQQRVFHVSLSRGTIECGQNTSIRSAPVDTWNATPLAWYEIWKLAPRKPPAHFVLGFGWDSEGVVINSRLSEGFFDVFIPCWAVVGGLLVLSLLLARHKRPLAPDTCYTCGYNLTGNTSGVCPECGTPIDEKLKGTA